MAYVSHFYIRERLNKHTTKILEGIYHERYREILLGFTIIFSGLFILISIQYLSALITFKPSNKQNKNWLSQILANCPVSTQLTDLTFQDAVYTEYGLTFYILGAYTGMIVDAKKYKGTVRTVNQTTFLKKLIRVSLSLIPVVFIFALPVFLIKSRSYILPIFLIKWAIPSFLIGNILFGYSKTVYAKFGLINEEDTNIVKEKGVNMGRFEEQEDIREFTGKKNSKLYEEGLLQSSTY